MLRDYSATSEKQNISLKQMNNAHVPWKIQKLCSLSFIRPLLGRFYNCPKYASRKTDRLYIIVINSLAKDNKKNEILIKNRTFERASIFGTEGSTDNDNSCNL